MIHPEIQKERDFERNENLIWNIAILTSLHLFFLSLFGSVEDGTIKPKPSLGLSFEEKSGGFVDKSWE